MENTTKLNVDKIVEESKLVGKKEKPEWYNGEIKYKTGSYIKYNGKVYKAKK